MAILEFIRHLDQHLGGLILQMGPGIYVLLFLIVFAETGLVFMPFLPGDTLLFASGMAAAGVLKGPKGEEVSLSLPLVLLLLTIAPILGDTVNYQMGKRIGPRLFNKESGKFFNPKNLAKTQGFFAKYGGKAVIVARWVPIVRTFAPFVAGMGAMRYGDFFKFSVIGAFLWVWVCTLAGYFLGSIPLVKENFEIAMLALIAVTVAPIAYEFIKEKKAHTVGG